jgi:hypothetical protein
MTIDKLKAKIEQVLDEAKKRMEAAAPDIVGKEESRAAVREWSILNDAFRLVDQWRPDVIEKLIEIIESEKDAEIMSLREKLVAETLAGLASLDRLENEIVKLAEVK